jgi:chromosomal replication initiation ATPase DnaA
MSLVEQYHNDRKAIRQRIAAKASENEDRKRAQDNAAQIAVLEKREDERAPDRDEWAERQKENHRPVWFSVISATKVCRSGAPTIRTIQRTTCDVFGVKLSDLLSARRHAPIVRPRLVSMYLARELTGLSLARIGHATGGRDHSCTIHACRKIGLLIKSDYELTRAIELIRERLA